MSNRKSLLKKLKGVSATESVRRMPHREVPVGASHVRA